MPIEHGQLIVCVTEEALTEVTTDGDVREGLPLADLIGGTQSRLHPLFGENQERLRRHAADLRPRYGPVIPDLSRFYVVTTEDADRGRAPDAFAAEIATNDLVETAYFKPEYELPSNGAPPFPTPDFTSRQGYLEPAPKGIDAFHAWTYPGGHGEDVRIIDIEKSWRFTHEDLAYNLSGGLNSVPNDQVVWRNHGTAVVGILGGDVNTFGIRGICPAAAVAGMSIMTFGGSARAMVRAVDRLRRGDILLLEIHGQGPLTPLEQTQVQTNSDLEQLGFLPPEYWPDDFAALKYATNRGVVVVSAAGNGQRDLELVDQIVTSGPATGWANPFVRDPADSGTILVGGGAPPVGGGPPDRSRLVYSNYGSCLDSQAWGDHVVTTGGAGGGQPGDLQGGPYEDRWYTDSFAGTSSAAPIVAGALACVQGILRAAGHARLTPRQARDLLRASGSPQVAETDGSLKRIGTRPNLRELIPRALDATGPAGPEEESQGGYCGCCGPGIAIFVGGCGGFSDWEQARWRGPDWEQARWRGPDWHRRERRYRGPYDREGPFGAGEVIPDAPGTTAPTSTGGRRPVGRPGF